MDDKQIWEQAQQVWTVESQAVKALKDSIHSDAVISAVHMIADCKSRNGRVLTAGVGTSGVAAKKIAHSFSCVEIPSFFLSPADGVHGALGALQKNDVVIAISKGGGTQEIVKILPAIKRKGAKLIGVTENEESILAKESDLVVKVRVEREADSFNMLATASTMAVIAVFDAIAVALMDYTGYTKEQFVVIHPGGAVGERLLKGEGEDGK